MKIRRLGLQCLGIYAILLVAASSHAQSNITYELGYTVDGATSGEQFSGGGAFTPGDLNGDGIADLLISSPQADSAEGAGDSRGLLTALSGPTGDVLWEVRGAFSLDRLSGPFFGPAVRLPGDLNSDGVPDVLVGTREGDSAEGASDNVGSIIAVSGADGSQLYTISGQTLADQFGSDQTLVLPDQNSDGIADFLISSRFADPPPSTAGDNVGEIRLVSGADGATISSATGFGTINQIGEAGMVVPGDVNMDGVVEYIGISAFGGSGSDGGMILFSGATGAVITSTPSEEFRPSDDSPAIDLNGDGFLDVIVASGLYTDGANLFVGAVRAYSGANLALLWEAVGDTPGDRLGSVGTITIEDISGDGVADVVTAAFQLDNGALNDVGMVRALSGADGTTLWTTLGIEDDEEVGREIFSGGDLDGDGVIDIVSVNRFATVGGQSSVGRVRVYSGRTGALLFTKEGQFSGDRFGSRGILPIPDINADGNVDLVISAHEASQVSGDFRGVAQVVSGADGSTLLSLFGPQPRDGLTGTPDCGDIIGTHAPGDLNQDGIGDFILSGPTAVFGGGFPSPDAAIVYFSGADGSVLFDYRAPTGLALGCEGNFSPGDLNGDSIPDFVASTSFTNPDQRGVFTVLLSSLSDNCPADPNKTEPGICGCGLADTDSDGDGALDCLDNCPADANKNEPGICGCGLVDTDSDGDGVLDCLDTCPTDPSKTSPGTCGCGESELCMCTSTPMEPLQFAIDGEAFELRTLVRRAIREQRRSARKENCTVANKRKRRALKLRAEESYQQVWRETWSIPAHHFSCGASTTNLPCVTTATGAVQSRVSAEGQQLVTTVEDALRPCGNRSKRGKTIMRKASSALANMNESMAQIPAEILSCRD